LQMQRVQQAVPLINVFLDRSSAGRYSTGSVRFVNPLCLPIQQEVSVWLVCSQNATLGVCGVWPDGRHTMFSVQLRPCLVRKNFQNFVSHRIFGRIHGVLNIDENKN